MYGLKPILSEQNINLPDCMFKLKPVNAEMAGNSQDSINNSVSAVLGKIFLHNNN
jgi:hypothetical protein